MKTVRILLLVVFLLSCTVHELDERSVKQDINLTFYFQGEDGKSHPVTVVPTPVKPTPTTPPKVQLITKEVGCPLFVWPEIGKRPAFPEETLLINDDGIVASKFLAYIEALEDYLSHHVSTFQKAYETHKQGCKKDTAG